ncbi:MAG: 50S ribosomal protein L22 [Holosporales bacterium]|jgi:large subunit ribosomal protein L22|nr:50S ribosomal protein L22 [Holosporales bacterium]
MAKRLLIKARSVDVFARSRIISSTTRKLGLVTELIRGLPVERALNCLTFCKKSAAYDVKKVLQSAVANAENNYGLDVDLLRVKEAYVGKALTMKRWLPRAKGRGTPLKKEYSHLTIVVCEVEN